MAQLSSSPNGPVATTICSLLERLQGELSGKQSNCI
jgi:hypothetical protein